MHSRCDGEASQPCYNGCLPSSLFPSEKSHNTPERSSNVKGSNDDLAATTASTLYPYTQFTNHEAIPCLHDSYMNFTRAFPSFSNTCQLDQIRAQEYHHLNQSNICFDYTGYGLFSHAQEGRPSHPATLIASSSSWPPSLPCSAPEPPFFDISYKPVNLHSQILYGGQESKLESRIRERIMAFMNFSESEYAVIFTANEVSAFKLIAGSFHFESNGELLTIYDHKSEALDAMTEICKEQGPQIMSAEFYWPNLVIRWKKLKKMIVNRRGKRKGSGLFVFPVRSRVTGAPYSYMWLSMAQENGWHVLLDASALGPKEMDTLGLSIFKPDFLVCSFYKVFGDNPSGFGCLFVKKSSISALKDSGNPASTGIVSIAPAFPQSQLQEEFDIPDDEETQPNADAGGAVSSEIECRGLDQADSTGLLLISCRSRYLINWLVTALMSLQHPHPETHSLSLIRIYGPKVNSHRGPAVAFNVFDWKGEKIDPALVQKLADRNNISLSRAILQNIQFSDKNEEERQKALESRVREEKRLVPSKKTHDQDCGIPVVTAALGFLTNFEDVYRLWAFLSRFLDADFVEKERWRYMALNQTTIDI